MFTKISPTKMNSRQGKISLCLLCLITVMLVSQIAHSQFFTKSSKSIPRMGRRSVSGPSAPLSAASQHYRRSLIDSLLDQYGPDMVEVLEAQARASEAKRASQAEVALRNDQPIDLVHSQAELGDSPIEIFSVDRLASQNMGRDERSLHSFPASGGLAAAAPMASVLARNNQQLPAGSNREPSLALRAFNTNRLLQQLASGQPPLASYDMLAYQTAQDKQFYKQQQRRQDKAEAEKYLSSEDK